MDQLSECTRIIVCDICRECHLVNCDHIQSVHIRIPRMGKQNDPNTWKYYSGISWLCDNCLQYSGLVRDTWNDNNWLATYVFLEQELDRLDAKQQKIREQQKEAWQIMKGTAMTIIKRNT